MRGLSAIVSGIALAAFASTASADHCTYDFKIKAAKEVIGPAEIEIYSKYEERGGEIILSGLVEIITPVIRTQKGPLIEGNYAIALENVGSAKDHYGKIVSRELEEGSAVRFRLPPHAEGIRFAKERRLDKATRDMLADNILTSEEVEEINDTLKEVDGGNRSLMLVVYGKSNGCDVAYNLPIVFSTERADVRTPQSPAPAIGTPENLPREKSPRQEEDNVHIENNIYINIKEGKIDHHRKKGHVSSLQELSLGYLFDKGKFEHDTMIGDCRLEQEETLTMNAILLRYGAISPNSRMSIEGGPAWSRDKTKSTFYDPFPCETRTAYDGAGVVGRFSADGRLMDESFSPEVGIGMESFALWNEKQAIPAEKQFGSLEGRLGFIAGNYYQLHAGAHVLGGLRFSDDSRYMFIKTKNPVIESTAGFGVGVGDRDNFDASVSVYSVFPVDNSPLEMPSFLGHPEISADLVLRHVFPHGWFIRGEGRYSHASLNLIDSSTYEISDGSVGIGIGKRW